MFKDYNTRFHHTMVIVRNKKNKIREMFYGGRNFKGLGVIKERVMNHYKQHFKKRHHPKTHLPEGSIRKIDLQCAS